MSRLFSCCFPTAHRADGDHYLIVKYLDGRREHLTGPVQLFFNHFKHRYELIKRVYI